MTGFRLNTNVLSVFDQTIYLFPLVLQLFPFVAVVKVVRCSSYLVTQGCSREPKMREILDMSITSVSSLIRLFVN